MRLFSFLDPLITRWMADHGIKFLRYSIALIFIWFGALKYFPGLSPAEDLAIATVNLMTFDLIPPQVSIFLLATLEVLIGALMLSGKWLRFTILLLLFQMVGTMSPIVLFPDQVFTQIPFGLTLEGQYIIKNFVVISAAIVIGATVRGGHLTPDPTG
ncbi:MAG: DoxX family membrane protein [Balneolaceae bacterium]